MAESPQSVADEDTVPPATLWLSVERQLEHAGGRCVLSGTVASEHLPSAFHGAETMDSLGSKTGPAVPPADLVHCGISGAASIPPNLLRSAADGDGDSNNVSVSVWRADTIGSQPQQARFDDAGTDAAADVLGRGAQGTVVRVDTPNGTQIARKRIPLHSGGHLATDFRTRLRAELQICKALMRRPRCEFPRVYDVVISGTEAVVDMEYLSGGAAAALAPLPTRVLRNVTRDLCAAVAILHDEMRVVHRDIKPENVLLAGGGKAKLADFGCAMIAPPTATPTQHLAVDQSGTLSYMSPERLRGEPHGFPSDIWALGVTVAVLATGRHPFLPPPNDPASTETDFTARFWQLAESIRHTDSLAECEAATRHAVATALSEVRDVSIVQLVERCTTADAAARPTAHALLSSLPFTD